MSFVAKRSVRLIVSLAGIFVIISLINDILYPFPLPIAYILGKIRFPALVAGALVTGRVHNINLAFVYVALFFTYIIVFSILIFACEILLAKTIKPKKKR